MPLQSRRAGKWGRLTVCAIMQGGTTAVRLQRGLQCMNLKRKLQCVGEMDSCFSLVGLSIQRKLTYRYLARASQGSGQLLVYGFRGLDYVFISRHARVSHACGCDRIAMPSGLHAWCRALRVGNRWSLRMFALVGSFLVGKFCHFGVPRLQRLGMHSAPIDHARGSLE